VHGQLPRLAVQALRQLVAQVRFEQGEQGDPVDLRGTLGADAGGLGTPGRTQQRHGQEGDDAGHDDERFH